MTSLLSDITSTVNTLRRRSTRESIRSIVSFRKDKSRKSSGYYPYSIYDQTMVPLILRDPDTTTKLLEVILDSPNGKRTLARLARTCRAMKEPALAVLWRELDSLIPILGLFPSEVLKRARKPGMGMTRPPRDADWNSVTKYGERVQRIAYDEILNNISPTVFPILEQHRPIPFIFPNLKHLTWRAESPAGLDRCSMFLNPQLETLSLDLVGRQPQLNVFLADMSSRLKLTSFSLFSSTSLPSSFSELLLPQDGLQKLVLMVPGALSSNVGRWIASLPQLKSLQLDLSGKSVIAVESFFEELRARSGDSTPSSVGTTDSGVFSGEEVDFSDIRKSALRLTGDLSSKGSFMHVRQLQLTGGVLEIAVFLKHLPSPLIQLELVIEDPPDKADWQDLSAMVCDRFGAALQSLRISATASSRFNDIVRSTSRGEPAANRLSLEHLTNLPALLRLDIDLPESVIFTAADISCLASACPNIEEVRLSPLARFPIPGGPPKLHLRSLAPLMRCKSLHTLAVVVNGTGGSPEVLSSREFSSDSLLRLHVGHSWISDFLHVTILLSHLTPRLETLKWFHERNRPGFIETNAKGWEKVYEALPHLQNMRLAEREFGPRVVEYILEPVVAPETAEKGVNATVLAIDQGVLARPQMKNSSMQFSPVLVDQTIDVKPNLCSASVQAIPQIFDVAIGATVSVVERSVEARQSTRSREVDATAPTSKSSAPPHILSPLILQHLSLWSILSFPKNIISLLFSPRYLLHSLMNNLRWQSPQKPQEDSNISMDNLQVRAH
ncbi:hypothetical protein C8J56DRAFT_918472 [Mycena floridula]|nr:hypothetical protein C8J56DRAFT_918472 [Mycena floridula]